MCPEAELLDHLVILGLNFWKITIPFSTVAAPLSIPTNDVPGFQCLHVLTNLLLSHSLTVAVLAGVKWYLTVVFIYIFLMINHVGHLFMCLLTICVSYLENVYVKSFAHFLIGLLIFLLLLFLSCL